LTNVNGLTYEAILAVSASENYLNGFFPGE